MLPACFRLDQHGGGIQLAASWAALIRERTGSSCTVQDLVCELGVLPDVPIKLRTQLGILLVKHFRGKFGANAAWFRLDVLSPNLLSVLKGSPYPAICGLPNRSGSGSWCSTPSGRS
jgi:hypothetical protein